MGLLDDEELLRRPTFGNSSLARQAARTRALQAARSNDVNTLPDPQTYAFIQGLLGEAPDQMGFSPMHPDYKKIMGRGEQGMVTGEVSMVGPTAKAIKGLAGLGAKTLGPTAVRMGEGYLQRQGLMPGVVPESGGAKASNAREAEVGRVNRRIATTGQYVGAPLELTHHSHWVQW